MFHSQQERADDTRRAICDAVVDLLLEVDYDHITVSQVSEMAHVSRTTFYRYFSSVYEAVEHIGNEILGVMENANRLGLMTRLGKASTDVTPTLVMRLETLRANRLACLALLGPHGSPDFRIKVGKIMSSYFLKKLEGSGLSVEERDLYLHFLVDGHNSLIRNWLHDHPDMTPEQVGALLNRLFYSALVYEPVGSTLDRSS